MWDSYMGYYATGILLVPAILFTLYAQAKVKSAFRRYSSVRNDRNLTGAQAARMVLDAMKADGKYNKVVLCYIQGNQAAKHLYEKIGFAETGRDEDEIIMELNF